MSKRICWIFSTIIFSFILFDFVCSPKPEQSKSQSSSHQIVPISTNNDDEEFYDAQAIDPNDILEDDEPSSEKSATQKSNSIQSQIQDQRVPSPTNIRQGPMVPHVQNSDISRTDDRRTNNGPIRLRNDDILIRGITPRMISFRRSNGISIQLNSFLSIGFLLFLICSI